VPKTVRAILYLRSSKDKHDVSIDMQRRELTELARARGAVIVGEFADSVESANDLERPGFKALTHALKSRDREWSEILVTDTARLARNTYLAEWFRHEAAKRGVKIIFSKLPEVNPQMDVMMRNMSQTYDQLHSMMCKEKGLAGMAENVRQGWRAGGRAPYGYVLVQHETGAVRDGKPVMKSKLEPSELAPKIAAYLKNRAAGRSAVVLIRELGIDLKPTTLNGLEWNALTYAGHTVWNVQNERMLDGYKMGRKRRPRSEWLITRDTHPALITDAQAEALIARLEAGRTRYRTKADYLLTGILVTTAGQAWHGNRNGESLFYRVGKKMIKTDAVDQAVLARVARDLNTEAFAAALIEKTMKALNTGHDGAELAAVDREVADRERKIARLANLVSETTAPAALLRKIEELETEREGLARRRAALQDDLERVRMAKRVTPADVRRLLANLAADMATLDRENLKDFLRGLIARVELNPADASCRIHYAIRASTGDLVASPRGTVEMPRVTLVSNVALLRRRRQA
jgi:DNA invertase Pin-like site-specific DNA recombinase